MKIAIIGLGWIGHPLAIKLSRDYDVVGSKRDLSSLDMDPSYGITPYTLTLPLMHDESVEKHPLSKYLTHPSIKGLFDKTECLVITLPASRNPSVLSQYRQSVKQLIDLAISFSINHVIFTSSTSVYGDAPGCYNEFSACHPLSGPGKALVELEQWLIATLKEKITILRLAGLAGPGRHPGRFFQNTDISSSLEGSASINFVHRTDVIHAIETIIKHRLTYVTSSCNLALKPIYNLCAPIHPSRNRFYRQASSLLGLPAPIFQQGNEQRVDFPFKNQQRVIDGFAITRDTHFRYLYPNPFDFTYNESINSIVPF